MIFSLVLQVFHSYASVAQQPFDKLQKVAIAQALAILKARTYYPLTLCKIMYLNNMEKSQSDDLSTRSWEEGGEELG